MTTRIYYFTGTGNSLKIAKDIAARLGGAELVSIPQALAEGETVCTADVMGIVFPVYMLGAPAIVTDFLKNLSAGDGTYTFVTVNHGAKPGPGGTFPQVHSLLKKRDITLDAFFNIEMINNYTPMFGTVDKNRRDEVFRLERVKVEEIARAVENRTKNMPGGILTPLRHFLAFVNCRVLVPMVAREDKNFTVDDTCTGCGTCGRVCPVANIDLSGGTPVWQNHCQQCTACFNLCPVQAIQLGNPDRSRVSGRYRNPEVTVEEIIASNSV